MKTTLFNIVAVLALVAFSSCASKKAMGDATTLKKNQTEATQASAAAQGSQSVEQMAFLQTVSDNQVYAKDIVADASFDIALGDKNLSCDGQLRMRRDEIIRLQVFIPILRTEIARIDFTPDRVLLVDRYHKEYVEADYSQVSFLADNGITFYSLQALFWNQLFAPGEKAMKRSTLKQFVADLTSSDKEVPVTLTKGQMTYRWDAEKPSGRIVKTTVAYESKTHGKSQLVWDYADFRAVGVKMFPAQQKFSFTTGATGKSQKGSLGITLSTIKTTSDWDATTTLSSKYKKLEAQDILKKITSLQ